MEPKDYKNRTYLSAIESAKFLSMSVAKLHDIARKVDIKAFISASEQMRFKLEDLEDLEEYKNKHNIQSKKNINIQRVNVIEINGATQKIFTESPTKMSDLSDNSIHLMVTSPPYFDANLSAIDLKRNGIGCEINSEIVFNTIESLKKYQLKIKY